MAPITRFMSRLKPEETFPLFSLPQELVDRVYFFLIKSGSMAFLRTSRMINSQATPLANRHGVLRITNRNHGLKLKPLRSKLLRTIQNVEIGIEVSSCYRNRDSIVRDSILRFPCRDTPRNTCRIFCRVDLSDNTSITDAPAMLCRLSKIGNFKVIITEFSGYFSGQDPGLGDYPISDASRGLMASPVVKSECAIVERWLIHAFGPGVWHWQDSGVAGLRQLEFYPRRFGAANGSP